MMRVSLLILEEDLEAFTRCLHEEGLVQLLECSTEGSLGRHEVREIDNEIGLLSSRIDRMVNLLDEARQAGVEGGSFLDRIKNMVSASPPSEPRSVDLDTVKGTLQWCRDKVDPIAPELDRLGEVLRSAREERSSREGDLGLVRDLLPVKVPLASFRSAELTSSIFFYLPADRVETFQAAAREQISPVHISVISGATKRLLMAMSLEGDRVKLLTQIHRFEGEIIDLPPYDGVPSEVEGEILSIIENLDGRIRDTTGDIQRLAADNLDDLLVVQEVVNIERERINALKLLARTSRTTLFRGWVPESDVKRLEDVTSSLTSGRYVLKKEKPRDEEYTEVPIRLANRWPFNSFEWVTKMYGMPSYREIDPTALLLPTFIVFFGTCLSDAGYGIILATLSFFVLRKVWGEQMGLSLTLCGLATILMGWLMGGWFGNILYSGSWGYGPMIPLFKAGWKDPLASDGAVAVLSLSLLMGIIHLMLGHVTAIMVYARQNKLIKGLVVHVGWCLTLAFGSIFILWYLNLTEANATWQQLSTWGMTIGIIMGIAGYIWDRSGPARAAGPAQFLYDILGHIADVISYSRLLALGISSAVNAFLIDLIIFQYAMPTLGPDAGVIRIVIAVVLGVLLAIGFLMLHLVNMGLNCLSGFVHTMRLHFAEYFGKFYESGGDEFTPFKSERSLTKVDAPEGAG
jgi:V/A-type H+-transporting ATPase subunit I